MGWLAEGGVDPGTIPWLNFGGLGVLAALLVVGIRYLVKFAQGSYADVIKQRDDCQDQVEQLQKDYVALLNTVLPLVTQATSAMTAFIDEARRIRETR